MRTLKSKLGHLVWYQNFQNRIYKHYIIVATKCNTVKLWFVFNEVAYFKHLAMLCSHTKGVDYKKILRLPEPLTETTNQAKVDVP